MVRMRSASKKIVSKSRETASVRSENLEGNKNEFRFEMWGLGLSESS